MSETERTSPLSDKTILLVDDDPEVLRSIHDALAEHGPTVLQAEDGRTAMELAKQHPPDVVILDQMMPGHNGLVLLEYLRGKKRPCQRPQVIMITANEGARHEQFALQQGAVGYLRKPFGVRKLLTMIQDAVARIED